MRGRGTRKAKGKALFTMFDFVGVSEYHGDDDAVGVGGAIAERKPPARKHQPRTLLVIDVDDHIDPLSRAWITTDEDGRMVFPEASAARAAEAGAPFEAWLLLHGSLPADQSRWLGLLGNLIRANANASTEHTVVRLAFAPVSL